MDENGLYLIKVLRNQNFFYEFCAVFYQLNVKLIISMQSGFPSERKDGNSKILKTKYYFTMNLSRVVHQHWHSFESCAALQVQ